MNGNFRKRLILYTYLLLAVVNIVVLSIIIYNFEPKIIKFILNFIGHHLGWWTCRFILGLLILNEATDLLIHSIFYGSSFLMIFILGYIRVFSEWGANRVVFGFCNSGVWLLSERSIKLKISPENQSRFFSLFLAIYHMGSLIVQNFMDRGYYSINYLHKPYQFSGGMFACFSCYALLPRIVYWGVPDKNNISLNVNKDTKSLNFLKKPFKFLWINLLNDSKKLTNWNFRRFFTKTLKTKHEKINYIDSIKKIFHYKQIILFLVGFCSLLPFITYQYIKIQQLNYRFHFHILWIFLGMISACVFKFLNIGNLLSKISPICKFRINLVILTTISVYYTYYIGQSVSYYGIFLNLLILWILGVIGYTFYPTLVIGIQFISHNKTYHDLRDMMDISLLLSNSFGIMWVTMYKFIYTITNSFTNLNKNKISEITTYNGFFNSFLNCYLFLIFFSILPEFVLMYIVRLKKSLSEWIRIRKVKARDKLLLKLKG